MLNPTIFREYDIRGIADTELASPDVAELGRALGTLLQRKSGRRINLGRDCRLSSPRLRDALLQGLAASGCEVTDIGVVPTPLLYFSAAHLEADGACPPLPTARRPLTPTPAAASRVEEGSPRGV